MQLTDKSITKQEKKKLANSPIIITNINRTHMHYLYSQAIKSSWYYVHHSLTYYTYIYIYTHAAIYITHKIVSSVFPRFWTIHVDSSRTIICSTRSRFKFFPASKSGVHTNEPKRHCEYGRENQNSQTYITEVGVSQAGRNHEHKQNGHKYNI